MTTELVKQSAPSALNLFDKEQFETLQRICKMFANSELVPDMYKISDKNSESKAMANCMIAIEIAQRIGASPLLIMQNLVIIYGRPSWSSKFLISTVNTCGRFNPLQYKFKSLGKVGKVEYVTYEKTWVPESGNKKGYYKTESKKEVFDGTNLENTECIAFTSAKGSDVILESSPISVKMAIQEGWYQKPGSKWPNMTQQMQMYRSASFWTNAYAPELSMGMKTAEEVQDTIDLEEGKGYTVETTSEAEIKEKANKTPLKTKPTEAPVATPETTKAPEEKAAQEAPKVAPTVTEQPKPQPEVKQASPAEQNTPPSMREGASLFKEDEPGF